MVHESSFGLNWFSRGGSHFHPGRVRGRRDAQNQSNHREGKNAQKSEILLELRAD